MLLYGLPLSVGLTPMTGVAFVLFTFYMITDPGATPSRWKGQVVSRASSYLTRFGYNILSGFWARGAWVDKFQP